MRGRGGGLTASPTMVGALTVMVVILAVFLAYNANSGLPVRAHLPGLGPGPERRHAGPGQRGAGRRRARWRGRGDRAAAERERRPQRPPRPEARPRRRPDPGRLDRDRALALGARAQVPGDQHGQLRRGLRRGRRDAARLRDVPEPVELDTVLSMFDARDPRPPPRRTWSSSATRSPAAGRAQLRARPPARRARGAGAGDAQPLLAGDQPRRVHQRARRHRGRGRAGRRDPGADVRLASTPPSPPSPRSPARSSRSRSPRARRPRSCRSRPCREIRELLVNSTGLFNDLEPAAVALRQTSPTIAASLEAGTPILAKSDQLNKPAGADLRVAAAADQQRARPRRDHARRRWPPTSSARRSSSSPRRRRSATTSAILAGNFNGVFTGGNELGAWQRFIVFDIPKGPNCEGGPSSGIANGGRLRRQELPPFQPLPEHRRARADVRVRGRQRALQGGQGRVRQPARQPGHEHQEPGPDAGRNRDDALMALFQRKSGQPVKKRNPNAPVPDPRIYGRHYTGPPRLGLRPDRRRADRLRRLHGVREEAPVHRRGLHRSTPSSRTPPPCARPRRCGSPASTSAR